MQTSVALELLGVQHPSLSLTSPLQISSNGPAAVALAQAAGLKLDPWQQWVVENALGEKDEWYYNSVLDRMMRRSSAYEIALIVARQNGKGSIMEALELAWLYLLGAKTILHSAHEFATSKEHFQRIESLVSGMPELRAELARGGIKWSHGDESISLANGQRLLFKTRTKGAARGFSIDKLVMDEAMILKQDAVSAMTYATSARPDVQIMYAGSAGDQESEHFGRARSRGIKGAEQALFFAEWSANLCSPMCPKGPRGEFICEEHDDPTDPSVWAKANPALGYRIQYDGIASELARDPEGFKRERLTVGDWPVDGEAWRVIAQDLWKARIDPASAVSMHDAPVFSIDTSPDRRWSCIAVAGSNGEDMIHGEITGRFSPDGGSLLDYRQGVDWVVRRAREMHERHPRAQWVIDKGTQAGAFWDELEKGGLKLIPMTLREHAQACGQFFSSVVPLGGSAPDFVHIDQPELTTAVANVDTRLVADMWVWDVRQEGGQPITPLVALTNACWGYRKTMHKKRPKPMAAWGG